MYYANQFLRQLEIANRLAKSKMPQDKRLAVILLDNAIEIDLRKKAGSELYYDQPRWETSRKHKTDERRQIERFFASLLKFSISKKHISKDEKRQIEFCHTVRNLLFHGNSSEELLVDATLLIQFYLITDHPERWGKGTGYVSSYRFLKGKKSVPSAGYENRYFRTEEGKLPLLDLRPHWKAAVHRILTYGSKSRTKPASLLSRSAKIFLKRIEQNILKLEKELGHCDINRALFFDVISGQIQINGINEAPLRKKILIVLSYFSCRRKLEENLADMEHSIRPSKFAEHFRESISQKPRFPIDALKKAHSAADRISAMETTEALQAYQSIRSSFETLADAASDASDKLTGYWEHLYESYYK